MRRLCALSTFALLVLAAAPALADGPHEPNETAAMVTSPTTSSVAAALETPQDVDWYLLLPRGVRQVGVLATLGTACSSPTGQVRVNVFDADGSVLPLDTLVLRRDHASGASGITSDHLRYTSKAGHRYFLRVTQTGCEYATYSISFAPSDVLGTHLDPTAECTDSRRAASKQRAALKRLKVLRRRARGARRRGLQQKVELRAQQVTKAEADAKTACSRKPLSGYPWT